MDTLPQLLQKANYTNRIFNERQLSDVVGGSDARRYGLTNRAMKAGDLQRLKRGLYMLGPNYRSTKAHPFAVAQALLPGSYISFETALSYHGWIPEAVYTTASVTPYRKSAEYSNEALGTFTFTPLATCQYQFMVGVDRVKFEELTAFVASPLRALADLAAARKLEWMGIPWLTENMRIDKEHIRNVRDSEIVNLKAVYKHRSMQDYLAGLSGELDSLKAGMG